MKLQKLSFKLEVSTQGKIKKCYYFRHSTFQTDSNKAESLPLYDNILSGKLNVSA